MPEKRETEAEKGYFRIKAGQQRLYTITLILFILINLVLGMMSEPIIGIIESGLNHFA